MSLPVPCREEGYTHAATMRFLKLVVVSSSPHLSKLPASLTGAWPGAPAPLQDRKWQLKAADEAEWQQWLAQQKQAANITADTIYVQVGSTHSGSRCRLADPAAAAGGLDPLPQCGHNRNARS